MLFTFSFMAAWFAIMFWTYEIRSSKWSSIMKLTVKPADWWSTNTGWCRSISCEEVSCCFLLYMLLYCIFQVLRFYYFEKSFYSISSEFNRYFCILGKGFIQVTYLRTTLAIRGSLPCAMNQENETLKSDSPIIFCLDLLLQFLW